MKYKCLVLDHDDTVVQTERCIGYPYFKEYLAKIRPGTELTFRQYVEDCNNMVFADVCRLRWNMTEEEQTQEYQGWKIYYRDHPRPIFPGIDRLIARQKAEGGLVCVASLSRRDDILSDYAEKNGARLLCCGDFNTNPPKLAEYLPRFSRANADLLTYADRSIDNVLYLGYQVENVHTIDTTTSRVTDHNMLVCDVIL
jgi:hypothetical protein